MLKVLVVDDDKMARRGIMAEMPWAAFGMQVVGEASNGEQALKFIRSNDIDILLTDLAMPVMSGLNLMRAVKKEFPHIWLVVLTFHQDFELIQEALRIGAIDYIAKTQLEQAKMEDVLGRIRDRIEQDSGAHGKLSGAAGLAASEYKGMLIFIALEESANAAELQRCSGMAASRLQEIHYGVWGTGMTGEDGTGDELTAELQRQLPADRWMALHVTGVDLVEWDQLRRGLLGFKENKLFYAYRRHQRVYACLASELLESRSGWTESQIAELRERLAAFAWVFYDDRFQALLAELEALKLPVSRLEAMFHAARIHWLRIVPDDRLSQHEPPGAQSFWADWVGWLAGVRELLLGQVQKAPYTEEIKLGVMRALQYINEHMNEDIKHQDLASIANMSKGYFSQIFKDMFGKTFHEYIRDARIENARLLLEQTEHSIYKIAELSGYPNEKYFSRVFREQMGMLPRDYRNQKRKGKNNTK